MVFTVALVKTTCMRKECQPQFDTFETDGCEYEDIEREFNPELFKVIQLDVDYPRVSKFARMFGWTDITLPDELPSDFSTNEEEQRKLYQVLFNREIISAVLRCPHCGAEYVIENKILKMIPPADPVSEENQ